MLPRGRAIVKQIFDVLYIFPFRCPYYGLQQNFGKEACAMKGNQQNNQTSHSDRNEQEQNKQ